MPAGQQNILAINNGATWGTAAACNKAGAGIYGLLDDGGPERLSDPIEAPGLTIAGQANHGGFTCAPSIHDAPFNYNFTPRLLSLFALDVATIVGAGPTYTHRFSAPTATHSRFLTIAEEIPQVAGASVYREIPGFAGTSLAIKGSLNGVVMMDVGGLGNNVVFPATVNTTLAAVTRPETNAFATMAANDADFFAIADQGSALVNLVISSFSWSLETPREGGDFGTGSATIGLPDESGMHVCRLEITIPRLAVTTHHADLQALTAKNAVFTFPTVTVDGNSLLATIKLPHLVPIAPKVPTVQGKLTETLAFLVLADDASTPVAVAAAQTTGGVAWEITVTGTVTTAYSTALS